MGQLPSLRASPGKWQQSSVKRPPVSSKSGNDCTVRSELSQLKPFVSLIPLEHLRRDIRGIAQRSSTPRTAVSTSFSTSTAIAGQVVGARAITGIGSDGGLDHGLFDVCGRRVGQGNRVSQQKEHKGYQHPYHALIILLAWMVRCDCHP